MLTLNLFPIPRRYERIPGVLAFALAAALVIVYFKERTTLSLILLFASIVLLVFVYWLRSRQKKERVDFFDRENKRLLSMTGAAGPAAYIPQQQTVVASLRHPELKRTAQLNLATACLANADPRNTLEILSTFDSLNLPNPTMRLVYWTLALGAYMQMKDTKNAATAYETAMGILEEVSDMLKVTFMPSEIQYQLLIGDYQLALNELNELTTEGLNEASMDLLTALRIRALEGLGVADKAEKLREKIAGHDMLPSTRALLS